jgi:Tol biopolymer transport system component
MAVVLVVVLYRAQRVRAPREVALAAPGSSETASSSTQASLRQIQPAQKPVDVYFLSEAGTRDPKSKPSGMRQPDCNGSRRITNPRAITSKAEGHFLSPKWSPDGLELMFSSPGFSGLYTKGLNGGAVSQVTSKDHIGFGAEWDEDGKIKTKTNDGKKQEFESDGTPAGSVSPEEDTSVVGPFTKDDTVYYRSAEGEAALPVSQGDDRYYGGVVSPDGKYIAYNGLHTGLYVAALDGSSCVNLGEGYSPSWLPDGSGVVYNISQDDGHYLTSSDLYLATADGSMVSNLTGTPYEVEVNPTVSPDGTQVVYEVDGVIYVGTLR